MALEPPFSWNGKCSRNNKNNNNNKTSELSLILLYYFLNINNKNLSSFFFLLFLLSLLSTDSGNPEGGWSEWSEWTECSRQCGGGRQQRTRTCDGAGYRSSDCEGPAVMERVCNLQPCKGYWSCWTEWTPCTATCGQGTRSRSRTCSIEGGEGSAGVNELDVEGCVGPSEMKEYCNNPSCERKLLFYFYTHLHCIDFRFTSPPRRVAIENSIGWSTKPYNTFILLVLVFEIRSRKQFAT